MHKYLIATLATPLSPCLYGLIPTALPARTTILIKYDDDDHLTLLVLSPFTHKIISLSLEDCVMLDLKLDPPYHTFINDRILLRGIESPFTPDKRSKFYSSLWSLILILMSCSAVFLTSCAGREVFFAQHQAIGTYLDTSTDTSAGDTLTVILK